MIVKKWAFVILVGTISMWHYTLAVLAAGGLSYFVWRHALKAERPGLRAWQTTFALLAAWWLFLLVIAGAA